MRVHSLLILQCIWPHVLSAPESCQSSLDILFVQDATTGFTDDFVYFREHRTILNVTEHIQSNYPSSRFGLLSFRDKPIWPAGGASDYCSRLDLDLSDDAASFAEAYTSLNAAGGGDWAEGQFGALVDALRSKKISWRRESNATRLIIMITDAPVHFAGDGIGHVHQLPPFDVNEPNVDSCIKRDYPSMAQLKEIAKESGTYIGIVVEDETPAQLPMRAWKWVSEQLEQEKIDVVALAPDGSNFTTAIESVLRRVNQIGSGTEGDEQCTLDALPQGYGERLSSALLCLKQREVEFVGREDPSYILATTPQDTWFSRPDTLAIVYPRKVETVQAAVECAFDNKVNIIARSGGHDYSSYSYGVDNDIILDLAYMENLDLDSQSGIARVGPGLRLSPLIYDAFLNGQWMVPAGACTAVGLGGHATGGGYGYYSRALGLLSDRIIGGKMVLGNGTLVRFDKESNSDLLWAMQGGTAANFGILTELTLQMLQAPPVATALTIAYPATSLGPVLKGMTVMLEKAPRELGFSAVWDNAKTAIQMNYFGKYVEALEVLKPFFDVAGQGIILGTESDFLRSFASLAILSITDTERPATPIPTILLPKLNTTAETYVPPRESYQAKSMLWGSSGPLDDACIETIVNAVAGAPVNFGVAIELWGGDSAIAERTAYGTAFPHHNATFVSHIYAKNPKAITPLDTAFLAQYYDKVVKCASNSVYVNYKDFELGQDTLNPLTWTTSGDAEKANQMYFGTSLERLKSIKDVYNPWNAFWFPQAI